LTPITLPICLLERRISPLHAFSPRTSNQLMVLMVIYVAAVGVLRAAAFTYGSIKELAREGAEVLETTVLDIGDAPPPLQAQAQAQAQAPATGAVGDGSGAVVSGAGTEAGGDRRDDASEAARFIV